MVAVGAPRLSMGCYSVPTANLALRLRGGGSLPLVSDESLVELCRGRTRGSKGRAVSNKGAASGCCSTHQPSNYFAVSPPNVLARLDEGCFAPKTNPPASALLLVSCDASCLCGRAWFCRHTVAKRSLFPAQVFVQDVLSTRCELWPSLRHV